MEIKKNRQKGKKTKKEKRIALRETKKIKGLIGSVVERKSSEFDPPLEVKFVLHLILSSVPPQEPEQSRIYRAPF